LVNEKKPTLVVTCNYNISQERAYSWSRHLLSYVKTKKYLLWKYIFYYIYNFYILNKICEKKKKKKKLTILLYIKCYNLWYIGCYWN